MGRIVVGNKNQLKNETSMLYAQVDHNMVSNVLTLNDPGLIPLFEEGHQYLIRIDELPSIPGIGWSYDGDNFLPPEPESPKGKRLPSVDRDTRDQIDAVEGTIVFNTDTKKLNLFDGEVWSELA